MVRYLQKEAHSTRIHTRAGPRASDAKFCLLGRPCSSLDDPQHHHGPIAIHLGAIGCALRSPASTRKRPTIPDILGTEYVPSAEQSSLLASATEAGKYSLLRAAPKDSA